MFIIFWFFQVGEGGQTQTSNWLGEVYLHPPGPQTHLVFGEVTTPFSPSPSAPQTQTTPLQTGVGGSMSESRASMALPDLSETKRTALIRRALSERFPIKT